jgi:hypothetical protein
VRSFVPVTDLEILESLEWSAEDEDDLEDAPAQADSVEVAPQR